MLLTIAFLLFAGVAAGGVTMVALRSRGGIPPLIRRGHALTAVVALALLLYAALTDGRPAVWLATGIFAAGLTGGYLLFGVMYKGKRTSGLMIAAHASLGAAGLAVLGYALLG